MTVTIGRFSSPKVKRVEVDGDRVTFGFDLNPSGTSVAKAAELQALRQQLVGLVGNEDEPVVPLTWTLDSTFDGFYKPVSSSPGNSRLMIGKSFWGDASITLERLTGFSNPSFEVTVDSKVRANAHGITVPPSVVMTSLGTSASVLDVSLNYPAALAGVSAAVVRGVEPALLTLNAYRVAAPLAATWYQFVFPPASAYLGACKVEVLYGSTWYPAIGRNIGKVRQGSWRITNGMIRLTLSTTLLGAVTLEVYNRDALAWQSVALKHFDSAAEGIGWGMNGVANPVSIVRNSPESVTVAHSDNFGLTEYFTVQRGNYHVVWHTVRNYGGANLNSSNHGVKFSSVTASTAITAGIRSTANDTNGNRWVFASPVAQTTDVVNGSTRIAADASTATFMLGAELHGSAAATGDAAADIVNQFFGAVSWRQRVIVR